MRLESARGLKQELLERVVEPFADEASAVRRAGARAVADAAAAAGVTEHVTFGIGARPAAELSPRQRTIAIGVAPHQGGFRLAVRVQRPELLHSALVSRLTREASGEADVRVIGRIDKRATTRRARSGGTHAKTRALLWYQHRVRPLNIGASIGHVKVTAGSIGGFVARGGKTYVLSNNHVLANEDLGKAGDWILQPGAYDGGTSPADRVARLRYWVKLKTTAANVVDCAMGRIESGVHADPSRLRGLVGGADRALAGLGPEMIDEGVDVYKVGRTTGPTHGRVTAFDLDNVVVGYDQGNLRFDHQIEIEGTGAKSFSDGGDSGSLIVDADMRAVALLFAGGDTGGSNGMGLTYANPIHDVLTQLKATLLS